MSRLKDWQLALTVVAAVAVGVAASLVFRTSRQSRPDSANLRQSNSIMLADPQDPPAERMSNREAIGDKDGGKGSTEKRAPILGEAASGERAKLEAAKSALKARVAAGSATDSDMRLLRGLCRQLRDSSCN